MDSISASTTLSVGVLESQIESRGPPEPDWNPEALHSFLVTAGRPRTNDCFGSRRVRQNLLQTVKASGETTV